MIIKEQSYRIKRGTKASDLPSQRASSPPPLDSLDGPFRLAEYLAYKVWRDPHDVRRLVELPRGDEGEPRQDKNVWIYEHLRRLPIDLTPLLTALLPICTKESCPQMKADEWMYLCVAHGGAGTEECCAIDYILHTVDSTATLLNSSKSFPSRMSIPSSSLSHFPSLFRRLSRIFSHAYYHHREAFSLAEAETSLYTRFVALCETYDLVGSNLLVIPKSAISNLGEPSHRDNGNEATIGESEDAEDDDDEGTSRGRDGEEREKERRTQSLDRNPSPAEERGARRMELLPKTPASGSEMASVQTAKHEPVGLDRSKTVKTLGRGKQNRGTMLWSSDTPPVPSNSVEDPAAIAEGADAGTNGLERTESRETAVHLSPEPREALLPPFEGAADRASEATSAASQDGANDPHSGEASESVHQSAQADREGGSVEPLTSPPVPVLSNAGQTAEGASAPSLASTSAPAEAAAEDKQDHGEMVDIKLDDAQPEASPDAEPAITTSPPIASASPPESFIPKSPNPDLSPSRTKSNHGAGRLSKPSTPAKSFVGSVKSPAAPLLSTGGSGDSPAKTGDAAASTTVATPGAAAPTAAPASAAVQEKADTAEGEPSADAAKALPATEADA